MPFSESVRLQLAHEVGGKCSADHCRKPTGLPQTSQFNLPNSGDGAHIRGSRRGTARFDELQPEAERESAGNGIWLCPDCHRRADRSPDIFTVALLHLWKQSAIQRYRNEVATGRIDADDGYLRQNELEKAREFLHLQGPLYASLRNFMSQTGTRFSVLSEFFFPDDARTKVIYFGGAFQMEWNNHHRLWPFSRSIHRWEAELLRICGLMARRDGMCNFNVPLVVDVARSESGAYIDPLIQGIDSYIQQFDSFRSFLDTF